MVLTTGCQLDIAPSSEPQYAELMVSSLFSHILSLMVVVSNICFFINFFHIVWIVFYFNVLNLQ